MTDLTQDELRKLALLCGWPEDGICENKMLDHAGAPLMRTEIYAFWHSWRPMHDANHCRMISDSILHTYREQLEVERDLRYPGHVRWHVRFTRGCGHESVSNSATASTELEARCRAALAVLDAEEQGGESDER